MAHFKKYFEPPKSVVNAYTPFSYIIEGTRIIQFISSLKAVNLLPILK